ncbi:MAG: M64 family metallopeptidase [Butyrivibrio sp.]
MKKRKWVKPVASIILTLCMILSVIVIPVGDTTVYASDEIGDLRLVYGDSSLPDEEALVLLILGDGFTLTEQEDFYQAAEDTADYMMNYSPYDEFQDTIKIYAISTVSNESGARGDAASSYLEAEADTRDTYFGSTFWSYGTQRLLTVSLEGEEKGNNIRDTYLPDADYNVYIVNSEVYGGSGGEYCVASLNSQSLDMMLHELGHTVANLADEYYAPGYEAENVNLTQESDPTQVSWSRFIGKNGIGVYYYGNPDTGWYIPSLDCKMQYLSTEYTDYPFCEVCKEEIRKAFCRNSDVTKLFFQTYADEFYDGQGKDMKEYFILRRGDKEITGDKLGTALTLTYYTAEDVLLSGIPSTAGDYKIRAEFAGNEDFEPCSLEAEYTIAPAGLSLSISSKKQDGTPAPLEYAVEYDDEYSLEIIYEGEQSYGYYLYDFYYSYMYTDTPDAGEGEYAVEHYVYDYSIGDYTKGETYTSPEGPTAPGTYEVTVNIYDTNGDPLASKSAYYQIAFNTNRIVDNNDPYYYGAIDGSNNKNILIYGEGFTAEEQDEFEKLALQFAEEILSIEPFKETKLYFNFIAVNSISEESGIGTAAKDTFFGLTYDENGKIVPVYNAASIATSLAYYNINSYYNDCIVIINDKNVKESATYFYDNGAYYSLHTIFAKPDKEGMEYAAYELLNHLTYMDAGYRAKTAEEKAELRETLLSNMWYTYCPVIVSRAYDETFTENGTAFDLTPYFHVYYGGEERKDVELALTYYTDNNGKPGERLNGAPSKAGTYHVYAETVSNDDGYWVYLESDGTWLGLSRGWTTYTIQPKTENIPVGDNGMPIKYLVILLAASAAILGAGFVKINSKKSLKEIIHK